MGKGNRNRDVRSIDQIDLPQKKKRAKKPMPKWLVSTISIAIAVVLIVGIVAFCIFCIVRSKKKGKKCIGCPHGESCGGHCE